VPGYILAVDHLLGLICSSFTDASVDGEGVGRMGTSTPPELLAGPGLPPTHIHNSETLLEFDVQSEP